MQPSRPSWRALSARARSFALPAALAALAALAGAVAAQNAATPGAGTRPNVLLLVVDDLNNSLGCYGHPLVQTPAIDRLAQRGVVFDRAYCQFTACNPSRVSLLTGLYPHQTGVQGNLGHFRDALPDTVTLPQQFRTHGYFSARVGKVFHAAVPNDIGEDGADDPASWDEVVNPRGRDRDEEHRIRAIRDGVGLHATLSWYAAEGRDEEQTDGIGASALIELMRTHHPDATGRPFFLAMGFYRPHTPFVAPRRYFDLYPLDAIEPVANPADDGDDIPAAGLPIRDSWREMTDDVRRELIRAYYASISFVDAQVGRILDALDELDLARRTIVVLVSDHGYALGRHGLWQKANLFEGTCRAPLIVADPAMSSTAGQRSRALVELVDLYPTLVDRCGLPAPPHLVGRSLAPLLAEPSRPGRDTAYTMSIAHNGTHSDAPRAFGHSVRSARYRYTEWGKNGALGVELYDHKHDAHEYENLAGAPALESAQQAHREALHAVLAREPLFVPPSPARYALATLAALLLGALLVAITLFRRRARA